MALTSAMALRFAAAALAVAFAAVLAPAGPAHAQPAPDASPQRGFSTGAEALRHLEEIDMLERARAEQAVSRAEPAPVQSNETPPDGDLIRRQAIDAEVARRLSEIEREAELDEISARLRAKAAGTPIPIREPIAPTDRAAVERRHIPRVTVPQPAPEAASIPVEEDVTQSDENRSRPDAAHSTALGTRVTIVLAMSPGHTGIRRNNPTADPVICIERTCWVSRGPDRDARSLTRAKALGPGNTLGDRAASCNGSTVCIFRNVDLGAETAVVQPIDLRILRHDRREPRMVSIDRDCSPASGASGCGAQDGPDYSLWVIPEETGARSGAAHLVALATRSRLSNRSRRADAPF